MRVLALDTTTRAGSVALVEDDRVVDERGGDGARSYAERLPAEILEIAAAHHVELSAIDLYAVASGPGSFTGIRIGIATIQGLAFVHARRVVPVPALEALAQGASTDLPDGSVIAAWSDAYRHEVFAAIYRVTAAARASRRLEVVEAPTVGDPVLTLARWSEQGRALPMVFVGEGATMYAAEIRHAAPAARVLSSPLLAGTIGRMAIARAAEALEASAVRPLYVRKPDVEIARDRK